MTDVPNISRSEAKAIYEALLALTAISKRADHGSRDPHDPAAMNLARLHVIADVGADAVFEVMNLASSYLGEPNAERVMKRWAKR